VSQVVTILLCHYNKSIAEKRQEKVQQGLDDEEHEDEAGNYDAMAWSVGKVIDLHTASFCNLEGTLGSREGRVESVKVSHN